MNNLYLHIGASRTGTTWLYKNLVERHPEIESLLPNRKYTAFWNQHTHRSFHFKRTGKQIPLKTIEWYKQLFNNRNPNVLLSDFTDGNSWQPVETVQEIKKQFPDVKITFAIRNPIITIISHVIKHDKRVSPRAPFPTIKQALLDPQYVYNTHYIENIHKWKDLFGEQVFLYFFTDISKPTTLLKNISTHLEIDSAFWNSFSDEQLSGKVNEGTQKQPVSDEVLEFLADYHKDRIHQMEDYFNKDLSHWLEGKE